ncbi:hypothetical protein BH11CYA1_BH11CYA1_23230 [soil metagenome]
MNQFNGFPSTLRHVAILGRSVCAESRSRWQDISSNYQWHDLNQFACAVRGVERLDPPLVMSTFFTSEAEAMMMSLPNSFWFFNVMHYAAGYPTTAGLIDKHILDRVFDHLRSRLATVYDLEKAIDQLSASELAVRVAEGVIVFKSQSWQHLNGAELVFNVIFQPKA